MNCELLELRTFLRESSWILVINLEQTYQSQNQINENEVTQHLDRVLGAHCYELHIKVDRDLWV